MSVGVSALDDDHQRLVGIVNELHEGIVASHKKEILASVLNHLEEYIRFHFAREEEFFSKAHYPGATAHRAEHEGFVIRVANLNERLKTSSVAMLDLELMSFLRNWLITHIQGSDKKYGPCLNAHGIT